MSIHFRDQCMRAQDVVCNVPIESKWNKTQPNLVMRGYAEKVEIIELSESFEENQGKKADFRIKLIGIFSAMGHCYAGYKNNQLRIKIQEKERGGEYTLV